MINQVALTGRLTKEVDLRYTQGGTAVASFTLAVERNFTNAQGERESDFLNCVIWRKSAENFANFTRKGSLVGIEGRLQTRSYDNAQGQRVFITEVVVDNFALLESRATTEARPRGEQSPQQRQQGVQNPGRGNYNRSSQNAAQRPQQANTDPFAHQSAPTIKDEDLPF
ncbi:single-stranded DNA-binding protein [Lacticaseibacillus hulanensis]|uniref:single-stranded DNA-binding protein n=1 Tax=Lacticaseibacillus hulanensis TaxID=2493111 RepID=UPI000FD9DA26|nr:single-stranded DNA-binding protein [Lacticaseibacillus hulanensis]